jgi:hypothetical protein
MVLVFMTSTIDARENREVVTINIPGAFLHVTNKDYIVMQMNGTLAKLMAQMDLKLYRNVLGLLANLKKHVRLSEPYLDEATSDNNLSVEHNSMNN